MIIYPTAAVTRMLWTLLRPFLHTHVQKKLVLATSFEVPNTTTTQHCRTPHPVPLPPPPSYHHHQSTASWYEWLRHY